MKVRTVIVAAMLAVVGISLMWFWWSQKVTEAPSVIPENIADETESPLAEEVNGKAHISVDHRMGELLDSHAPPMLAATGSASGLRDDGWSKLERTRKGSFYRCLTAPRECRAEELFRNSVLNKKDTFIPKPEREELTRFTEYHNEYFKKFHSVYTEVRGKEIGERVAQGTARKRMLPDERSKIARDMLKTYMEKYDARQTVTTPEDEANRERYRRIVLSGKLFDKFRQPDAEIKHFENGKAYVFAIKELPHASVAWNYMRLARLEYYLSILNWFHMRGLVDDLRQEQLRQKGLDILGL